MSSLREAHMLELYGHELKRRYELLERALRESHHERGHGAYHADSHTEENLVAKLEELRPSVNWCSHALESLGRTLIHHLQVHSRRTKARKMRSRTISDVGEKMILAGENHGDLVISAESDLKEIQRHLRAIFRKVSWMTHTSDVRDRKHIHEFHSFVTAAYNYVQRFSQRNEAGSEHTLDRDAREFGIERNPGQRIYPRRTHSLRTRAFINTRKRAIINVRSPSVFSRGHIEYEGARKTYDQVFNEVYSRIRRKNPERLGNFMDALEMSVQKLVANTVHQVLKRSPDLLLVSPTVIDITLQSDLESSGLGGSYHLRSPLNHAFININVVEEYIEYVVRHDCIRNPRGHTVVLSPSSSAYHTIHHELTHARDPEAVKNREYVDYTHRLIHLPPSTTTVLLVHHLTQIRAEGFAQISAFIGQQHGPDGRIYLPVKEVLLHDMNLPAKLDTLVRRMSQPSFDHKAIDELIPTKLWYTLGAYMALVIVAEYTKAQARVFEAASIPSIDALVNDREKAPQIPFKHAFTNEHCVIIIEASPAKVHQALVKITHLKPDTYIRSFMKSAERLGIEHFTISDIISIANVEHAQAVHLAERLGFRS